MRLIMDINVKYHVLLDVVKDYYSALTLRKSKIHTYIPLTLYPRGGSKVTSDIPTRPPRFTKIT
jgi:hypothetical protein